MIPWYVALIAFVAGEIAGIVIMGLCVANGDEKRKCKYIK